MVCVLSPSKIWVFSYGVFCLSVANTAIIIPTWALDHPHPHRNATTFNGLISFVVRRNVTTFNGLISLVVRGNVTTFNALISLVVL